MKPQSAGEMHVFEVFGFSSHLSHSSSVFRRSGSDVVWVKTKARKLPAPLEADCFLPVAYLLAADALTNQERVLPGRRSIGFDPPKQSAERPNSIPADVPLALCHVILCILF